jgi:hypothetical protein
VVRAHLDAATNNAGVLIGINGIATDVEQHLAQPGRIAHEADTRRFLREIDLAGGGAQAMRE